MRSHTSRWFADATMEKDLCDLSYSQCCLHAVKSHDPSRVTLKHIQKKLALPPSSFFLLSDWRATLATLDLLIAVCLFDSIPDPYTTAAGTVGGFFRRLSVTPLMITPAIGHSAVLLL
jgi:hypothetical protein